MPPIHGDECASFTYREGQYLLVGGGVSGIPGVITGEDIMSQLS